MKNKLIGLVICIVLFIYFFGGVIYNFVLDKPIKDKSEVKSSNTIKGYEYLLYDDDLDIYKSEFNKLKKNLESKKIDYEEYAKSISKMFLIKLYSLDNLDNKYDIKATEFIYPDATENFKLNVINTLNKYIEDNSEGNRKQELPIVNSVEVNSFEEVKFEISEKEYDAYKINLNIEYNKDLGYDKKAELIIVKSDKYLYIVEKN